MTSPLSWSLLEALDDREGAPAPYQRAFGGRPVEARAAAALAEGGDDLWRVAVAAGLLEQRLPDACPLRAPPAALSLSGAPALSRDAVAIGVVDGPVAFAHSRFRLASGATRLDWLWLLDAPRGDEPGDAPFGRELTGPGVDALIARRRTPDGVDEESVYRDVGALDMARPHARDLARRATHGTAVLGLAGGVAPAAPPPDPEAPGPADDARARSVARRPQDFPLMVAALPARLLADTSGAFTAAHVVLALDRMLRRAALLGRRRGRPLDIALCLSLGLTGGPCDGSGLLERYIDGVGAADVPGLGVRRFVLPVGNARQSMLRARLDAPLGPDAPPLWWRLPPDDATPSFLEIWSGPLPAPPVRCGLTLGVRLPGAAAPAMLEAPAFGHVYALGPAGGRVARAYVQWLPLDAARPGGEGRARIVLAAPPTLPGVAPAGPCDGVAPPGLWRLTVTQADPGAAWDPCDLFVQRDDSLEVDRPHGRQSRLVDPLCRRFDDAGRVLMEDDRVPPHGRPLARVRRGLTLNAYASGASVVLAGGRMGRGGGDAPYSSVGDGRCVELAVTEASRSRPGVAVCGARAGGLGRFGGASMAAPQVARGAAEAM
jgi:hypothetical protein